jgi:hypothetical protein
MERFEYEITTHSAESFARVVYFCSDAGDCSLEEVPVQEPAILANILNERGLNGWELVQMVFGKDGVLACWKRRLIYTDGV